MVLTKASSVIEVRLMRTFSRAPMTAVRAHIMATVASVTALLLPRRAAASIIGNNALAVRATSIGTSAAYFVSRWMASLRTAFSSSVSLGNLKAAKTRSYASASRSTSANSFADCSVIRAEICSISSFTSAYFLRPTVRLATMAASDAASEPFNAETLPPPGTGSLPVTLSINSFTDKLLSSI